MNTDVHTSYAGRELKGWHVLLMFLAFFGVMFAVNGVFLYSAVTSFPGEDVKKSYLQGLTYDDTLDRRAAQAELGWTAAIGLQDGEVVLRIDDSAGSRPAAGLAVVGELRRSVTDAGDAELAFTSHGAGEYRAPSGALGSGEWIVLVRAYGDAESLADPAAAPLFEARKTLYLYE